VGDDVEDRAGDRDRFMSLSCDLELAIRSMAREIHRVRAVVAAQQEEAERRARNLEDLAVANASLALVVATAIGWHQGRGSDDDLRAAIVALLEDPNVDETSKRLAHGVNEEP